MSKCTPYCIEHRNLTIYKNYVYSDYRDYIADILEYTLAHIDADDLKTCIDSKEESAQYKETLLLMDNLMDHFKDALTGLRNKTAFDNEVLRIQEMIDNGNTKVGVSVVDLNYLKQINDTYGHDKGDIAITKLCRTVCRIFSHSPVFRIGGDEFAVFILGEDYDNYDELIDLFYSRLENMANDDSLEPWEKVSAAFGTAFYDENTDADLESLFRRADRIMYERKKEMKANVR